MFSQLIFLWLPLQTRISLGKKRYSNKEQKEKVSFSFDVSEILVNYLLLKILEAILFNHSSKTQKEKRPF